MGSRALGLAIPLALLGFLFSRDAVALCCGLIAVALVARLVPSRCPLSVSLPWPLVAFAALPLLQVLPLGLHTHALDETLLTELASLGATLPPTWSFHPEATLRAAVSTVAVAAAFLLARHAAAKPSSRWTLILALLALALWQSVAGISQYFTGLWLLDEGQVAHGLFANRGYYAAFLGGLLWLALGVAASQYNRAAASSQSLALVVVSAVVALCSTAAIIASLSRTAFLVNASLFAAAIFALPLDRRKRAAAAFVAASIAAAVLATGYLQPILNRFAQGADPGRLLIWRDSLSSLHPLGSGAGTLRWAFQRSEPYFLRKVVESAHSSYVEWAVEFGPVMAIVFAAALCAALIRLITNASPEHRWLRLGAAFGGCALALHAAPDSILHSAPAAILLASLLGLAFGLSTPAPQRHQPLGTGLLAAGLCAATLLIGGALAPLNFDSAFTDARQRQFQADAPEARHAYAAALQANPRAATAWLGLAELARSDHDYQQSLRLTELARSIEPFTYRTEWAVADLELAHGQVPPGVERLRTLCLHLPDLRPAAYLLAWRAGAPLDLIETRLTAPEPYAVGEYLAFLIRTNNHHEVPAAFQRLVAAPQLPLSKAHSRYLAKHLTSEVWAEAGKN